MKITSRKEAAEIRHDGKQKVLQLWDVGAERATLDGTDYEFVREPEPVVMYTGDGLLRLFGKWRQDNPRSAHVKDDWMNWMDAEGLPLILARRTEMLRAMGSEELVRKVEGLADERHTGSYIIALIADHIEANRPELTLDIIDGWYAEWSGEEQGDALAHFIAHRAAEYGSPAVAGLRAENARLKSTNAQQASEIEALSAELDAAEDALGLNSRVSKEPCDVAQAARVLRMECAQLKGTVNELYNKLTIRSPQPVDDSDEYGILVQDGAVYLMKRKWMGLIRTVDWETHVRIVDVSGPLRIDPTRIFKVTSQPSGVLKVPSEEEIEVWAQRYALPEQSHVRAGCRSGAREAIEWIKKANGAK